MAAKHPRNQWMRGKSVHELERTWARINDRIDFLMDKNFHRTGVYVPKVGHPLREALKRLVDMQVDINLRQKLLRRRVRRRVRRAVR